MSAETNFDASGLCGVEPLPSRHASWVSALFVVLLVLTLAPIVLLALMMRAPREAWQDPTFPPALALVCAAPLVPLAGVIGARRGWNGALLAFLALIAIAWLLFVAWVLLIMICAAL